MSHEAFELLPRLGGQGSPRGCSACAPWGSGLLVAGTEGSLSLFAPPGTPHPGTTHPQHQHQHQHWHKHKHQQRLMGGGGRERPEASWPSPGGAPSSPRCPPPRWTSYLWAGAPSCWSCSPTKCACGASLSWSPRQALDSTAGASRWTPGARRGGALGGGQEERPAFQPPGYSHALPTYAPLLCQLIWPIGPNAVLARKPLLSNAVLAGRPFLRLVDPPSASLSAALAQAHNPLPFSLLRWRQLISPLPLSLLCWRQLSKHLSLSPCCAGASWHPVRGGAAHRHPRGRAGPRVQSGAPPSARPWGASTGSCARPRTHTRTPAHRRIRTTNTTRTSSSSSSSSKVGRRIKRRRTAGCPWSPLATCQGPAFCPFLRGSSFWERCAVPLPPCWLPLSPVLAPAVTLLAPLSLFWLPCHSTGFDVTLLAPLSLHWLPLSLYRLCCHSTLAPPSLRCPCPWRTRTH